MSRQSDFAATVVTQLSEYATSLSAHFADQFPGEHLVIATPQVTLIAAPVEVEAPTTPEPDAAPTHEDTLV